MDAFDELARRQHGVVTRSQAIEMLEHRAFRRALASGHLVPVASGVYRCAGAPVTFRQRSMAACLAFGPLVAVSHRSAAVLWGYEPVQRGPEVEVSLPRERSGRRAGVRAYRSDLRPLDVVQRFGIAVTCAGRTLLDLAGHVTPAVLERCVDDALRARQSTADELLGWLDGRDRRGRGGAGELRALLRRRVGSGVGDSSGVDEVYRWIARAGLPLPVLGLAVAVAGRQRLIDLAYPAELVAIEFNGWEFHQMRSRMDADHVRTTELELAGWLVIVVTAGHSEAETVDRIGQALVLRRPATAVPGGTRVSESAGRAPAGWL